LCADFTVKCITEFYFVRGFHCEMYYGIFIFSMNHALMCVSHAWFLRIYV